MHARCIVRSYILWSRRCRSLPCIYVVDLALVPFRHSGAYTSDTTGHVAQVPWWDPAAVHSV